MALTKKQKKAEIEAIKDMLEEQQLLFGDLPLKGHPRKKIAKRFKKHLEKY